MKKLLNTLYVTTQGIYLRQEGETLVAEKDHATLLRLPIHTLTGIVCFGNVLCSPFLLGMCGEKGIHVSFLSEHGKFLARVEGGASGNVLLRLAQFKAATDPVKACDIARNCVTAKILNARNILLRRLRDHGPDPACSEAIAKLANVVQRLCNAPDTETVRGLEGEAAVAYFGTFNSLILAQSETFHMDGRNRRPPKDPLNALLSFIYTLLAHDCEGAAQSVGFDPQIGFLHALRPGRPSLALDIMEEFRAPLADRLAISLINLNQVNPHGFKVTESGAVMMADETRKTILSAWQTKKQEIIVHPFLNERIEIGLIPYVQVLLLARFLRGDIDAYPPFILK